MPIPLLERSDTEMARRLRRTVESLEEVAECREITVGFTRKKPNIHTHVLLRGNPTLEQTHLISFKIDRDVRNLVPNARVVIHSESSNLPNTKDLWKIVKTSADSEPRSRGVQNVHFVGSNGVVGVDLKLQVGSSVTGLPSDHIQSRIAEKIRANSSEVSEVVVHQDTVSHLVFSEKWGHGTELGSYIEHLVKRFPELVWVAPLTSRRSIDGLHLVDRVAFRPGTSSDRSSQIRSELGSALKQAYPEIVGADILEQQIPAGDV